jgi:hypothetical protein
MCPILISQQNSSFALLVLQKVALTKAEILTSSQHRVKHVLPSYFKEKYNKADNNPNV